MVLYSTEGCMMYNGCWLLMGEDTKTSHNYSVKMLRLEDSVLECC